MEWRTEGAGIAAGCGVMQRPRLRPQSDCWASALDGPIESVSISACGAAGDVLIVAARRSLERLVQAMEKRVNFSIDTLSVEAREYDFLMRCLGVLPLDTSDEVNATRSHGNNGLSGCSTSWI